MMKKIRKLFLMLFAIAFVLGVSQKVDAASNSMTIHAIDLGDNEGDSVLLESDGQYILMDSGAEAAYDKVDAYLTQKNVTSIALYYSHFHGDHTGGLGTGGTYDKLLGKYTITNIYLPDASLYLSKVDFSDFYEKISRIAENHGVTADKIVYLKVGSQFTIGSANFEVIGPVGVETFTEPGEPSEGDADSDGTYDDFVNNASLVTRVTCGNTVYLTGGDIKTEEEDALIAKYGTSGKLNADIFKLTHHGIAPANSEKFLAYVTPVCSFGQNGTYTDQEEYGDNGKTRRRTYTAKQNASQYGLCYMVADEKDSFVVNVDSDQIKLYRGSDLNNQLRGIVKTVGSYGIAYDGDNSNPFNFNDYYYLDGASHPITGIRSVQVENEGVQTHYFGNGGQLYVGTWGYDDDKFVYKAWKNVGEDWQYFYQKTAVMATGWQTIDGETYYFKKSNGYRFAGIREIDSAIYFFSESGKLVRDQWYNKTNNADTWQYYDKDGKRATGWQTISGETYYLDKNTGYRFVGVQQIDGSCYRFSDGGKLCKSSWYNDKQNDKKHWMYFGKDGKRVTGWFTIGKDKFYLDKKTGYRLVGVQKIDRNYYRFSDGGKLCKSSWYNDKKNNKKHWMYFDKDGKRVTGWQTIGKDKFYFNKETGYRLVGVQKVGSNYYRFSDGGKLCKSSWYNDKKKDKNHWMYFGKDGKRATGWQAISGDKYYFNKKSGYRMVGFKEIDSKYYYFSAGGKVTINKTINLNGYRCKFNRQGVCTNLPSDKAVTISKVKAMKKSAEVKWKKKDGSTGYNIYYATSKNGSYKKVATVKAGKGYSYKVKHLKKGKKYYFKVMSYTKIGDYKFNSKDSKVKSVKVK